MPSIRSIAIRNAQAVRMIQNRQYSEAQDLLEQGLLELEECDWLPEEEHEDNDDQQQQAQPNPTTTRSLLQLRTFPVKQESHGTWIPCHCADFCSFDKAFVFAVSSQQSPQLVGQQEQEQSQRISSYEYAVISCVLWFNTGLAARLCQNVTASMCPAQSSYECALEHLNELTATNEKQHSSMVLLLKLAVLNNAGYTMYRFSTNNDQESDKEEAMDRLDQVKENWAYSLRRGLDIPRNEAAVFLSNIRFQQEQRQPSSTSTSSCSAAQAA